MRTLRLIIQLLPWLLFTHAASQGVQEAVFTDALKSAKLVPDAVRFDPDALRFFFQDEFESPAFSSYLARPLQLPFYAMVLRGSLLAGMDSPAAFVEIGGRMIGDVTRRTLLGDPLAENDRKAKAKDALSEAVLSIYREANVPMPVPLRTKMMDELQNVPPFLQEQAAYLLYTVIDARAWRNDALAGVPDLNRVFRALTQPVEPARQNANDPDSFRLIHAAMQQVDLKRLLAGGHDVTLAAYRVAMRLKNAGEAERASLQKDFKFEVDTPWGRIGLHGTGGNTHPRLPYLLLIDTGGSDTYYGGAATLSVSNATSVLIDLQGDDKYLHNAQFLQTPVAEFDDRAKVPGIAFGGAALGYSVLIDVEGDDLYRTPAAGMGAARFGLGFLIDLAGEDRYDGYVFTQGAALFGAGVLYDQSGKDKYFSFQQAQGFGGTKGFGLLMDGGGDDEYIANNMQLDFPSPQSRESNANLCQGMGYGRRADYLDGHSLAGGIGVLLDRSGNDVYSCGVFGQGSGYWGGAGFLIDLQGDDVYKGVWYVQGAAAHRGIGYLEDRAGDDQYTATMNMAMGAGHDFSIGFFYEVSGNDSYDAPSLALGGGNANGIGIFLEERGNDRYKVRANSANLGRANPSDAGTLRERALCLGLFMDLGGNDTFPPELDFVGNGRSWLIWARQNEKPAESQVGIGVDK